MEDLIRDVNRISYDFLVKEPFYGHFFVGFIKQKQKAHNAISIQPTNDFVQFAIEEEYWFEKSDKVKKGLLKHELLHLVFKHPIRMKDFILKNIAYLAADLVVNQHLQLGELPEDAFTLQLLNKFGFFLEENKGLRYYYEQLELILNTCKQQCNGDSCDSQEGSGSKGQGMGNSSGSSKSDGDSQGASSTENRSELLGILEKRVGFSSHNSWRSFEEESESKNGLLEYNINYLLENIANKMAVSNSWGSVSGALKSYISKITLFQPQKVDWKRALKVFIASSQKTYLKTTISRPSKRYGTVPGVKIKRYCKICVAIDTSGSLSNKELSDYFHEIYHIWKQNTEIMIVECDVKIHQTYKYNGNMPSFVLGRGGTDFNAPIAYNNDVFQGDALIYLTDGYASKPIVKSKKPIFWLIFGGNKDAVNNLPGRVVYMN